MISFIEYLTEAVKKKAKLPVLHTQLGAASQGKKKAKPAPKKAQDKVSHASLFTGVKNEILFEKESSDFGTFKGSLGMHKKSEQDQIHRDNSPHTGQQTLHKHTIDSKELNDAAHRLYAGESIDGSLKARIKDMDDAVGAHKIEKDTHVYTGVAVPPHRDMTQDGRFHMPGYASASTDVDTAWEYAKAFHKGDKDEATKHFHDYLKENPPRNTDHGVDLTKDHKQHAFVKHVVKIDLPKGTAATSVRRLSKYEDEGEVLLHRGHVVKLDKRPSVKRTGINGTRVVWHGRIVAHEPTPLKE